MDTINAKPYKKLGGSGRRDSGLLGSGFSVSRLYIAATHLLCVDTLFFSEQCKRYHFQNIEALWYTPTKRWHFNSVLCVLGAGPGGLGLCVPDIRARIFFGIWIVVALALLMINIKRGPTCRTYIRTAAHVDQLPPVNRVFLAKMFFSRMGPLIEASQADIFDWPTPPPFVPDNAPETVAQAADQTPSPHADSSTEHRDL